MEVLERKSLCTKYDLYTSSPNSTARISVSAFLKPPSLSHTFTETENTIIDDILNVHGLTSHQLMNLLERLGRIIEMGQRVVKGTMHEQGGCHEIKHFPQWEDGAIRMKVDRDSKKSKSDKVSRRKTKSWLHKSVLRTGIEDLVCANKSTSRVSQVPRSMMRLAGSFMKN